MSWVRTNMVMVKNLRSGLGFELGFIPPFRQSAFGAFCSALNRSDTAGTASAFARAWTKMGSTVIGSNVLIYSQFSLRPK